MTVKANPAVVGGFVIGSIILMVISLLVLGSGRFFKNDMRLMAVFPGTVKGLHVGSPVLFRGVNIGSVTNIKIYHDPLKQVSLVPVYIDLKQEVMELINPNSGEAKLTEKQALAFMVSMVKSGLHARLTLESLVSGRQMVEFEIDPEIPIKLTGIDKEYLEIPTAESNLNKLQKLFESIPLKDLADNLVITVTEINKMFADEKSRSVLQNINAVVLGSRQLIDTLNEKIIHLAESGQKDLDEIQVLLKSTEVQLSKTLLELTRLSANLNDQLTLLSKSASNAIDKSDKAFTNINRMVDKESVARHNLEQSLDELSRAAKSFRVFTEYLERHPEAIIKGKQY